MLELGINFLGWRFMYILDMNFFCPLLEKFCPLIKHFAYLGSKGSSFCQLSSSGQEKGSFGVGLGVFCVRIYPRKGCVTAE